MLILPDPRTDVLDIFERDERMLENWKKEREENNPNDGDSSAWDEGDDWGDMQHTEHFHE